MKIKIIDEFSYQSFPITDDMVEIDENDIQQIGITKCFDTKNKKAIDYVNLKANEEILLNEIIKLEQWFQWYDKQIQEYSRCERLGIQYFNSENLTINQLDLLAEEKKKKINELKAKMIDN